MVSVLTEIATATVDDTISSDDPYGAGQVRTMSGHEKIKLTKEQRGDLISSIKKYFKQERGEDIGDLASGLMLDFIIERIAPEFYNQGVSDSSRYLSDRIEDMMSMQIIRPK